MIGQHHCDMWHGAGDFFNRFIVAWQGDVDFVGVVRNPDGFLRQRQSRDNGDLRHKATFGWHGHGIAADDFGVAHGATGAHRFFKCLDVKDFLKHDDVAIHFVDLLCGPVALGGVFVCAVGVEIRVKLEVRQGKIAQIKCTDAQADVV